MTLTELKYLLALARERHFGRAAAACYVSQPTLSVGVRKLEEELGLQLFERNHADVRPTPMGLAIIERAQQVMDQVNSIRELAQSGQNPLQGALRLGAIYTIAPFLMPALVQQVIRHHPEMPLLLQEDFTHRLLESLRSGGLDAAILAWPFDATGLDVLPLYDEPYAVALPPGHPLTLQSAIDPRALKAETMLLLGPGHCFREHVLEVCPEAAMLAHMGASASGSPPGQPTLEGASLQTLRFMVAAGLGLTLVPWLSTAAPDPLVVYRPLQAPEPSRRIVLAWRKGYARTPALLKLHSLLRGSGLQGLTWAPQDDLLPAADSATAAA